ncbi:MAG: hypothetical protein WCC48_01425 [Anaeromyxobacteraceae bacterium]
MIQLSIPVPLRHDETGLQVSRLARDAVLAAARRLPPALRVRVYGVLSRDERGWERQSLSAGPGPILFALALMDLDETVSAGVKLLHDLGEGPIPCACGSCSRGT